MGSICKDLKKEHIYRFSFKVILSGRYKLEHLHFHKHFLFFSLSAFNSGNFIIKL